MNHSFRYPALALFTLALLVGCANKEPQEQPDPVVTPAAEQTEQQQLLGKALEIQAKLLEQAQRGDLESQFKLGSSYFVGQPDKNLKQAEYWWKQAADKGHSMAAVSLAYLYTGRDAPELANQREMLRYLNQSAAAGNPMAQHVLGNLYRRGEGGLPRDPDQARRLYESACKQNYDVSCAALQHE
ncbi:Sel1 repeat family protein [Pseudomonas sp. 8Z]|uniref:tetratricopeptide repeat protein n=1 Tax=Pseudomonas sp. 8Z TaxID=2653166 RepID=UPI0012F22729|nr:tetratricopeptide repeat protein [Pseudomonas sp. 8Z]VXD05122.1 Sel1 repeat family protein [Pseudomonas sp. 8Z]